jgi:hypothetical protein
VQPAASAGPALRAIIAAGKFHGVIAPHTPTASKAALDRNESNGIRGGGFSLDLQVSAEQGGFPDDEGTGSLTRDITDRRRPM